MGKHNQIFKFWLENHATEGEKALSYEDQCHAIQMWLQQEENWRLTMAEMENFDAYGNPPARRPRN